MRWSGRRGSSFPGLGLTLQFGKVPEHGDFVGSSKVLGYIVVDLYGWLSKLWSLFGSLL